MSLHQLAGRTDGINALKCMHLSGREVCSFTSGQVLVGIGELVGCSINDAGLAPHAAARPDLPRLQVADRQGQQIRWNGNVLRSDTCIIARKQPC